MANPRPLKSAVELQALLLTSAKSKEITPSALAQVARAWCELEERKRILRMKPAPKPVDVSTLKQKREPKPAEFIGAET